MRLNDPTDATSLAMKAQAEAETYLASIGGAAGITAAIVAATDEVKYIVDEQAQLERFRGKPLLKRFFEEYGKHAGFSYSAFCYALATGIGDTDRLCRLTETPTRKIRQYVPGNLLNHVTECITLLEGMSEAESAVALAQEVSSARDAWAQGVEDCSDRTLLRRKLVELARVVKSAGHSHLHEQLLADLAQLGDR
jgi:hypothetical protein